MFSDSLGREHAAQKVAYKKYIEVKKVICFNKVLARFTSFDGYQNIFSRCAGHCTVVI